jgi:hypothetical protein
MMEDERIFLKTSATLPLIKIYRMSLIFSLILSLGSTFNSGVDQVKILYLIRSGFTALLQSQ